MGLRIISNIKIGLAPVQPLDQAPLAFSRVLIHRPLEVDGHLLGPRP